MIVPEITLKAKRIVTRVEGNRIQIVCFMYDKKCLAEARKFVDTETVVNIEDSNGTFTTSHRTMIESVEAPNHGGWGGPDDVLLVDLQIIQSQ